MEKIMNNAAVNNFDSTMHDFDRLDREIESAYNRASVDKHEQVNRASLNKDSFSRDAAMARKRANEFSADIEELAKIKRENLKKKVSFLKQQVSPQPQPEFKKVEQPVPATKDEIKKARNAGMGVGFWVGALTMAGIGAYALYKTNKRHNEEVDRLYKKINELEKNQK